MKGREPEAYAKLLCEAGAPVLSVVTEEKEFHGSLAMLRSIANQVDVPILRKDFIHTRKDLEETVAAGASAILLMCSCLTPEELRPLYSQALELGLDPFVETHKKEDFALVNELGAKLVGINNRDILVLERDEGNVSHTMGLAQYAPEDAFLVTESSIENPAQVRKAIAAGADAALVGTAILRAENTRLFYRMLCNPICLKVCGLMNERDVHMCIEQGVERLGLVTEYPVDVPWNLSADTAAKLRKEIPAGFQAVMVTGGESEAILARARKVRPDYVQMHYRESPEQMRYLVSELNQLGIGVIGKFPTSAKDRAAYFEGCSTEDIVRILCSTGIEEILIDPRSADNAAQKGLSADTELVRRVKELSPIPVILAGGITPENIREKMLVTGAVSVDVMNGSENQPGEKSKEKVEQLVKQINALMQ